MSHQESPNDRMRSLEKRVWEEQARKIYDEKHNCKIGTSRNLYEGVGTPGSFTPDYCIYQYCSD
eukprot:CAMPEP_0176443688 /NCGR_PEP_ID=MMETSP0127-20121128/22587_1 /TAXON_ID=938130 /ORGANISM="Platyophrya macrostoma, Strain WH" /LENGTH=63 /DNA_ID=CAMNT_0017828995 /DNA_START=856 /DNA_END=1047 /DNA_ORIENTATION=-